MYEKGDVSKLYFKYEGNTKDVSFYDYMDPKELFNKIKNDQIKFDDALKKKLFLNKLTKQDGTKGTGPKILTAKQMIQRLLIDLALVKAGNNSENLLNEIGKLFSPCINQKK